MIVSYSTVGGGGESHHGFYPKKNSINSVFSDVNRI